MDSSQIVIWMIAICVLFTFYVVLAKQIKIILKIIIRGIIGAFGIYIINFITVPLGASVGINFLTWFITGLLGIPGIALLFATAFLLR